MHKPLIAGTCVNYQNQTWRVESVLSTKRVVLINDDTCVRAVADPQELTGIATKDVSYVPAQVADSKDWQIAAFRLDCIQPLLNQKFPTRSAAVRRARESGVDTATLYRWKREYESTLQLSSLLPKKRAHKTRLDPEIDKVIGEVAEGYYLTMRRPGMASVALEVSRRCKEKGLKEPHENTVRNRLRSLNPAVIARRRFGRHEAQKFEQLKGTFPGANSPLAIVEIDHCYLPNILVDDTSERESIGRPWLTLGIDVYSRMITGFHLSFDPPGLASTSLCIVNSIMPKRDFIHAHNLKSDWPCWGKMDSVLVDNAKEFRSQAFVRACQEHGITIQYRPAKRPHFAGHVERFFGTIQKDLQTAPGSTFSNPKEKVDINPVQTAAMTVAELEHWLAVRIVDMYHNEVHSSLNTTPLRRFEQGLFDESAGPPRGLPAPIKNPEKLKLDFMPGFMRSIQSYGVVIDYKVYNHEALAPFVHARDSKGRKKKYLFKRDPSDVSVVHFWDSDLNTYLEIPNRDSSAPPMTLWQWRQLIKKAKMEAEEAKNPDLVFRSLERLSGVETTAVKSTKAARRGKKLPKRLAARPFAMYSRPKNAGGKNSIPSNLAEVTDEMVQPFGDLE